MDIHISNLPTTTSHKALKQHLKKRFASYGIHAFECNKPKGKPFAFITVPDVQLGERFLAAHAKHGALFLAQPLVVKRGHRTPDAHHVEGLRSRAREVIAHIPDSAGMIKLPTILTSCGFFTYKNNELVFRPEWEDRKMGMCVLGKTALTITTPVYESSSTQQSTLFRIPFSAVELMITDGTSPSLTMQLNLAPKAYHLPKAAGDILDILSNLTLSGDINKRLRVRGADANHENIMSTCLVYRVDVQRSDWSIVKSFLHHRQASVPSMMEYHLRKVAGRYPFQVERDVLLNKLEASSLPFLVKFQIQKVATWGYLLPGQIEALIPTLEHMAIGAGETMVMHAVRRFMHVIPSPYPDVVTAKQYGAETLVDTLKESLDYVQETPPAQVALGRRHEHLALVHRALVTPAGVYPEGPTLEPVNRVLREYSEFASTYFLRVNFKDEDGEPIRFDRNSSLEKIHDQWFRRVLESGIYLAGKTFAFLGFSNSSLKDQSCWFMAPFKRNGVHYDSWTVVQKLGNFSEIRAPAKCAARIGQAFSDTPGGAVKLDDNCDIQVIKDVERNGYVFSDGCGTISPALLRKVWSTYKRSCRPTLFQIRWAGAKGMVSLDDRLTGETLRIRKSMLKFFSNHNDLEICNAARRPLPFYLNRQLVKILEDLGVRADAFRNLQSDAIAELRVAATSARQAANFLDRKDVGTACSLSWLFERLDDLGIDPRNDRFLQQAIEHTILAELRMMKHKARIPVEDGHTLYGVMDETGILIEGQIFCRVDGKVRQGRVAVTRSPALHPGDVQHAIATEVPQSSPLMALNNCVVFSQHGQRDLPSMLSGGDLDGDIFNVIFDSTLIPPTRFEPASYRRPKPIDLYRQMERQDIIDWFIKFMKNDHLARIAVTHVQLADRYPGGTLHQDCLMLAELHSTAVDFQKTGIEVEMSKFPKYRNYKPHFMAPDPRLLRDMDKPLSFAEDEYIESDDEEGSDAVMNPDAGKVRSLYYHSDRVLGQLYDQIDERAFLREIDSVLPTLHGPSLHGATPMKQLWAYIQQRAVGIQWGHLEDFAWNIREEYEDSVVNLMHDYGHTPREPLSEIEVFMGSIIGKGGALPSRSVREGSRTMKDLFNEHATYFIRRIVHGNVDAMSALEFATVESWMGDTSTARDQALERSMACLKVALDEGYKWPALHHKRLVSFQYLAGMVALRELSVFEKRNAGRHHGLPILNL